MIADMNTRLRIRDEQRRRQDRIYAALAKQSPADRLMVARSILEGLAESGCSYADFQSAQAATREVRKAARALRGIG